MSKIKREPVLVATALVAVLNLLLGSDSGLSVDVVQTLVVAAGGLLVRSKVSPTAEAQACVCRECPNSTVA